MRKHSKQREAIQLYLATHSNHPTAETVYLGIKEMSALVQYIAIWLF